MKLFLFLFLNLLFSSAITDKCNERINVLFPNYLSKNHTLYKIDKTTKKEIQNIVKQRFFRDEVNIWHIVDKDSINYYAILDNVKGKSMPITFLTVFDDSASIVDISIIKYREPYGGEVGNKSWLKQFLSFTDTSNYKIGREIDAISGATISVHSVSKGIYKLSHLIHNIIRDINE